MSQPARPPTQTAKNGRKPGEPTPSPARGLGASEERSARRSRARAPHGPPETLSHVEVALGYVAQQDVVGCFGAFRLKQALEPFPDLFACHLHAVALEDLSDE